MPLLNVEARRVIEGEIEIDAADEDDAADKIGGMDNNEFMRVIDILTDEIETGTVDALDDADE